MTSRPLIFAAGITGFFIVALGAFGAHGLEGKLTAEAKDWWATATLYGLAHAVAALAVSGREGMGRAAAAFILGTLIFSGSLYLMALGAPRFLGAITPLGGLAFLAGWVQVAISGLKKA